MSIKQNEIEVKSGNAFGNCQLDRKKYADILTTIVSTYDSGFVLAINNKWGTGKTTFIRMWEQDLKDNGFQTVLFNAWENDFEDNALTALMGELKNLTNEEVNPNFEKALKNAALFTKNLAPALVKVMAKKYIGEGIEDIVEGLTKGVADIFEKDVNEYSAKKKSIKDFKENLSKFIADSSEEKPVVFIVDELDRCRPDYAVSILEQIKHFFSIPNIVFVLSIDKEQLGHAVRGVYGSDNIDSDEYLRRFIDIEYSIPQPDTDKYCDYLYNYFKFDEFFKSEKRKSISELNRDGLQFIKSSKIILKNTTVSLRQQEKIFAHSRLVLRSFPEENYVLPSLFFLLIFIKVTNSTFYNKIGLKQLTILELQQEFISIIKYKNINEDETEVVCLEAFLVHYYNNYKSTSYSKNVLYKKDENSGENKLLVSSFTDKTDKHSEFLHLIEQLSSGRRNGGDLDISYLLNRIDLMEGIKF